MFTAVENPTRSFAVDTYIGKSLSVLNGHFPGEPGLAGLLKLWMTEVVVTTGVIRRAKLQSNRHHQQTNT